MANGSVKGNNGPTPEVRFLVMDRDQERCLRCYTSCRGMRGWDWSIHHRRIKGMGGDSRTDTNLPGNLITLCGSGTTGCHGWVHNAGRLEASDHGWIISKFVKDPTSIPVSAWDQNGRRVTVYLDNFGGYMPDLLEV